MKRYRKALTPARKSRWYIANRQHRVVALDQFPGGYRTQKEALSIICFRLRIHGDDVSPHLTVISGHQIEGAI